MKRLALLLVLLLAASLTVNAYAAHPGDSVVVTFMIFSNPDKAISARIGYIYDEDVFEFAGAENVSMEILNAPPTRVDGKFGMLNPAGLSVGEVGRIILRIKGDAPLGTYEIKPVVDSVYDANRQPVTLEVQGAKVKIGHVWDEGSITVEPTCYTEGTMKWRCCYCSATKEAVLPVTTHREGISVDEVHATCTKDGRRIYPCEICHDVLREEVIPAFGHTEGEKVVVQEPTGLEDGIRAVQCATCGRTIRTESIPATGTDIPGDVNADGLVELADAVRLLQQGADRSVKISARNADVNADDSVDLQDALLLMQYLAGWNVTLK